MPTCGNRSGPELPNTSAGSRPQPCRPAASQATRAPCSSLPRKLALLHPLPTIPMQVRKLERQISLEELKGHSGPGGPLASMALFKYGRLSVQPVTEAEWEFVLGLEGQPAPQAAAKGKAVAKGAAAAAAKGKLAAAAAAGADGAAGGEGEAEADGKAAARGRASRAGGGGSRSRSRAGKEGGS